MGFPSLTFISSGAFPTRSWAPLSPEKPWVPSTAGSHARDTADELGTRPVHCRVVGSNPGLYPLGPAAPSPQLWQPRTSPDVKCPLQGPSPAGNRWLQKGLKSRELLGRLCLCEPLTEPCRLVTCMRAALRRGPATQVPSRETLRAIAQGFSSCF